MAGYGIQMHYTQAWRSLSSPVCKPGRSRTGGQMRGRRGEKVWKYIHLPAPSPVRSSHSKTMRGHARLSRPRSGALRSWLGQAALRIRWSGLMPLFGQGIQQVTAPDHRCHTGQIEPKRLQDGMLGCAGIETQDLSEAQLHPPRTGRGRGRVSHRPCLAWPNQPLTAPARMPLT